MIFRRISWRRILHVVSYEDSAATWSDLAELTHTTFWSSVSNAAWYSKRIRFRNRKHFLSYIFKQILSYEVPELRAIAELGDRALSGESMSNENMLDFHDNAFNQNENF